ncbi:S-methyl-5'-thioadenosine phosphorylase [Candidatus Woesearchaeota archaeon]|nr:S-methyl-5'-thioadenosine phosphorylase [Candidatus Woesearchaeota archaeon]
MMKIGIIGGSGLDDPRILKGAKETYVTTKFGNPSSGLAIGRINDIDVAVIARHGKRHTINPSNVNYRANIMALKEQGGTHISATTACGSLREEIKPGHLVFCDQFIDRTTKRAATFYESDKVCHIPMAEPFCRKLRNLLSETASEMGLEYHKKGTVITIEGPRFSTKAESHMYRQWNADVINMSTVPEAVLAREAGICYAIVAMSTDYDCFLEDRPEVTIEEVLKVMKQNSDNVKKLLLEVIPKINYIDCKCKEDIKTSIIGS